MSDETLLYLKYFSSALGVGVAFAGAWFFEYFKKDKITDKRSLTYAGRLAVVLALISLGFAGFVTVLTDRGAGKKDAKQQQQKEKEQAEARDWRAKTLESQTQTQKIGLENNKSNRELLDLLRQNLDKLSPERRGKVEQAVQGLNTVEEFQKKYPDLYAELKSASTFSDVAKTFGKGYELELQKHTGGCGPEVKLVDFRSGYQQGQIFQLSNEMGLTVTADPAGVRFQLDQPAKTIDLSDGYNFVFGDTQSAKLSCGINKGDVFISCQDWARGPELAAFELLQKKRLTGIKIKSETYPVPAQVADTIMRTLACIKP